MTEDEYPEVGPQAYALWLRAQRPPFRWFLGCSALEQEQLAELGDAYVGVCIEAGLEASTEPEPEADVVRRVVLEALQKPEDRPQARVQDVTHSMGGVSRRQQRREQQQQAAKDTHRSFMGRQPDEVKP
jgi:hypothetical protein